VTAAGAAIAPVNWRRGDRYKPPFRERNGLKVVSGKLGLIALLAAASLLLLWRHLTTQSANEPAIGFGYSSGQISKAREICTRLHGSEQERRQRLADCNGECGSLVSDASRECLSQCREKSQAYASCLLQYTTPP
jgi:hypothetical protein